MYIPIRDMVRHKNEALTYLTVEFYRYSLHDNFCIIIKDYWTYFIMYLVVSPTSYISEVIDTEKSVNIATPCFSLKTEIKIFIMILTLLTYGLVAWLGDSNSLYLVRMLLHSKHNLTGLVLDHLQIAKSSTTTVFRMFFFFFRIHSNANI